MAHHRDTFAVYLRNLDAEETGFRTVDDGRYVLQITRDVALYVNPDRDDLAAVIAGLRKLAEAAGETADALEAQRKAECPDPGPCVNGPAPHQWHTSCQEDRDL